MSCNPPLTDWRGKSAWLVGASSGIGRATAHALHAQGAQVFVSARNQLALDAFVLEHPGAVAVTLDAGDAASVKAAAGRVLESGALDMVLYCAGHYREMRATAFDLKDMLLHQQINYIGALYVLDALLPHFLARQSGHISLISSVAGYRGLPKSLAYGPTKAALINLAETLFVDLQRSHIGVSLVCPGFVETPLTAQNQFSMPGLIKPEAAATEILRGWAQGRFEIHFPRRFTLCMKALGLLPNALYFPVVRKFTGL
ncbi:MAG: family NAD(P)-dependent oxidoreductase [Polaromonas sp.]|jgi:NAD(P)-dependent dehydrogenase (short-subunit alcohol dehydrogenase family)|nr:family NAD(P)-dependent oxidoreductase [Polaromonas sp.]